ncbi:MAG: NYN domain-containing protein, partial [Eubacterium sp.]
RLGEIQVQLMGDIQLEILQSVISERFGINASFSKGSIIYKETIADTVEGVGHFEPLRHYAEVHLLMKPGKRDSGIIFKTECKEDMLDKNWQRLILTHLYEKTHIGVLTGSPITDMEIILKSGKAHPKHTEGGDFRQATYRAVRQGLRSADCILLEPIYEFTLEVPVENVGRAMTDIQRMSGSFNPPEAIEDSAVLSGTAPVSTMYDYARDVMQYTHGRGKLMCSLKGYEPCHNTQEVIENIGYDCDADTENPCDSVFCSHGAGYNVKWNEVKSHMHLPSVLCAPKSDYADESIKKAFSKCRDKDNLFALDKELMQIFEQTYGPIKNRSNNINQSHFTFTESSENKKYKATRPPRYEGTEYLLVDGYNVIFSWDRLKELSTDNIEGARNTLINILCNYQGYKKCEVILVFDAYKVKGNTREVEKVNNVNIVYTKEAETADMYIEKVSHKLAKNHKVRVVTSDALEQLIILGNGALRVSSREFLYEVQQAEKDIRNIIAETF